jgi:site-specific DNA-methyltransferase (adenine-specific)
MPPYWHDATHDLTIYCGDALEILPTLEPVHAVVVDPPYGQTSLSWDRWISGWMSRLPTNNVWCFGSFKSFLTHAEEFAGWKFAQDLVWRKHNGSSFANDRFRRVHESVVQFYRGPWSTLYKAPIKTLDAKRKVVVRRKRRPAQWGKVENLPFVSVDGGPRLQRSVIEVRSEHGRALHPTQKPLGILLPLIEYSVPPDGFVLDPFMGVGSTLLAAQHLGRGAIGVEIDEANCEKAVRRLQQRIAGVA